MLLVMTQVGGTLACAGSETETSINAVVARSSRVAVTVTVCEPDDANVTSVVPHGLRERAGGAGPSEFGAVGCFGLKRKRDADGRYSRGGRQVDEAAPDRWARGRACPRGRQRCRFRLIPSDRPRFAARKRVFDGFFGWRGVAAFNTNAAAPTS